MLDNFHVNGGTQRARARARKPPPGNISKFGRKMRKNLRNAILPKNQKNTAPGAP